MAKWTLTGRRRGGLANRSQFPNRPCIRTSQPQSLCSLVWPRLDARSVDNPPRPLWPARRVRPPTKSTVPLYPIHRSQVYCTCTTIPFTPVTSDRHSGTTVPYTPVTGDQYTGQRYIPILKYRYAGVSGPCFKPFKPHEICIKNAQHIVLQLRRVGATHPP